MKHFELTLSWIERGQSFMKKDRVTLETPPIIGEKLWTVYRGKLIYGEIIDLKEVTAVEFPYQK